MNSAPATSVKASPATCILCRLWSSTPTERAYTRGEHVPASDAHSALVLGYFLGLYAHEVKGGVGYCSVHAQQLEQHERSRDYGELARAIADGKDAGVLRAIHSTRGRS